MVNLPSIPAAKKCGASFPCNSFNVPWKWNATRLGFKRSPGRSMTGESGSMQQCMPPGNGQVVDPALSVNALVPNGDGNYYLGGGGSDLRDRKSMYKLIEGPSNHTLDPSCFSTRRSESYKHHACTKFLEGTCSRAAELHKRPSAAGRGSKEPVAEIHVACDHGSKGPWSMLPVAMYLFPRYM